MSTKEFQELRIEALEKRVKELEKELSKSKQNGTNNSCNSNTINNKK
jgi:ribosomal protein L29